jgi:hypothetical protein
VDGHLAASASLLHPSYHRSHLQLSILVHELV